MSDLLACGDAVVDGDDEVDALLRERVHGGAVHAVALAFTGGYVVGHVRACGLQIGIQHGGGGDAVGIIVAVNADVLAAVYRPAHARYRLVHVPDLHRVGDHAVVEEEILYLVVRGDPADLQQHGDDRGQIVFFFDCRSLCLVKRSDCP